MEAERRPSAPRSAAAQNPHVVRKSASAKVESPAAVAKPVPETHIDKPEAKPVQPRPHTAKPHGDNDFRIDSDGDPPANTPKH